VAGTLVHGRGLSKGAETRGIGDCLIGDDPQSQAHRMSLSKRKISVRAASYHRPLGRAAAVFRNASFGPGSARD
jgi:hypothetical protein